MRDRVRTEGELGGAVAAAATEEEGEGKAGRALSTGRVSTRRGFAQAQRRTEEMCTGPPPAKSRSPAGGKRQEGTPGGHPRSDD